MLNLISIKNDKYMLLAGWEVRIGKNCDQGLENAARDRRPRAAFSSPRSQFFPIRIDPKPDNNIFIFFSCWLSSGFVYSNLSLNSFTAPSRNHSQKENSERTKKDVLKKRFISNYLMLVAISSPVKFSKSVFSGVN